MRSILLLFAAAILAGCSGIPSAEKTKDNPACTSVVEGTFTSKSQYTANGSYDAKVPALILQVSSYETKAIHGKILDRTSEGFLFDEDRVGPFYDPAPKLYKYGEVACAIDSARNVIFGKLPDKNAIIWDLELVLGRTDDSTAKPIKFELPANEKFSLCVPAGQYEAKEILFKHGNDVDKGVDFPKLIFKVNSGKVNYVGDILLNADTADGPGVYRVPRKLQNRSSQASWGVMFGLAGALTAAMLADPNKILEGHRMRVQADEHYATALSLPLEVNLARFEPREPVPKPDEKK